VIGLGPGLSLPSPYPPLPPPLRTPARPEFQPVKVAPFARQCVSYLQPAGSCSHNHPWKAPQGAGELTPHHSRQSHAGLSSEPHGMTHAPLTHHRSPHAYTQAPRAHTTGPASDLAPHRPAARALPASQTECLLHLVQGKLTRQPSAPPSSSVSARASGTLLNGPVVTGCHS
jgi:hypothetical protein